MKELSLTGVTKLPQAPKPGVTSLRSEPEPSGPPTPRGGILHCCAGSQATLGVPGTCPTRRGMRCLLHYPWGCLASGVLISMNSSLSTSKELFGTCTGNDPAADPLRLRLTLHIFSQHPTSPTPRLRCASCGGLTWCSREAFGTRDGPLP